ncbi:MAG: ABC transporter permease, partial [Dehalococcoidia bacterium]
ILLFGVCLASVAGIWMTNRIMFRMGLRNIPRRGAQTGLVVVGLMLSTLIITAAFSTGDSLDYSITSSTYDSLQRNDLVLDFDGDAGGPRAIASQRYIDEQVVPELEAALAGDPDIEGFLPYLFERAPVLNPRTRLAESAVTVAGIDRERLPSLGGLRLLDGGRADLTALADDEALISRETANRLNVRTGDTLTLYVNDTTWNLRVAGIVENEVASGVINAGNPDDAGGLAVVLPVAQQIFGRAGEVNAVTVALEGDVRDSVGRSDAAAARLEEFFTADGAPAIFDSGSLGVTVETLKQDRVEQAEASGNLFTSFFLVLGLFSIAAGVMLIFMIFVMLAAERKTEMGMARAIGATRTNLVQSFVAEGMAYNLIAGAIGAALGVGAAYLLVTGAQPMLGDSASAITAHVTPRSLIISYCLGTVITFLTVVVSSLRVSRLNIVAAIRGTDDAAPHESRRRTRWLWVALGVPALVVPPLGLYWMLHKGFGLPSAWVWGPLGLCAGIAAILLAVPVESQALFFLGASLLPLSAATLARRFRAPIRPTWTLVGIYLVLLWLLPIDWAKLLLGAELKGAFEMFVLSGIMIVIGSTLVIVFNARLLTSLFRGSDGTGRAYLTPALLGLLAAASVLAGLALGEAANGLGQLCYLLAGLIAAMAVLAAAAARFPRFGPALKMGVAYPLANRFRTGMTIAMFSLIVFSLMMMSTLNANFTAVFASDDARGGWDVIATANRNNPVPDLIAALEAEGSLDTSSITTHGRATGVDLTSEVRQSGQGEEWTGYPVRAGDAAFFTELDATLDQRAAGYADDRAVYDAVRTQPGLAIVDGSVLSEGGFGPQAASDFRVEGISAGQTEFEPFQVEVRDPVTGESSSVTVIGILPATIPGQVMFGMYTSEDTFSGVFGEPDYRVNYLRLASGNDSEIVAKGIKAAMLTSGVEAFSVQTVIDDQQAQARGFSRILQAYLALGLFVGIAALGVIAFRSVVERRQQIGMLRAIGYQRGTVALTFLLESSFIALMGILSGVVGAAILARNLMTSADFTAEARGFDFFIPWTEVTLFIIVAFAFSLLLTWWPSRGAARIPIAEALRYE